MKLLDNIKKVFNDRGLFSLNNQANLGSGLLKNSLRNNFLYGDDLSQAITNPIISKIVHTKTGDALDDTIDFFNQENKDFYNENLKQEVYNSVANMLFFGRGIIIIFEKDKNYTEPLSEILNEGEYSIRAFSGIGVRVEQVVNDVNSIDYRKPLRYSNYNMTDIHSSRVIDFKYYDVPTKLKPEYNYGGQSETERVYNLVLILEQLNRAISTIADKSSSIWLGVQDLDEIGSVDESKLKNMLNFFSNLERNRRNTGISIIDKNHNVQNFSQQVAGLKDTSDFIISQISLISGIPKSILIGEQAGGLNSSGQIEAHLYARTISNLQTHYILPRLNNLLNKINRKEISFKQTQTLAPKEQTELEANRLDNLIKMDGLGIDISKKSEEYGFTEHKDIFNERQVNEALKDFD